MDTGYYSTFKRRRCIYNNPTYQSSRFTGISSVLTLHYARSHFNHGARLAVLQDIGSTAVIVGQIWVGGASAPCASALVAARSTADSAGGILKADHVVAASYWLRAWPEGETGVTRTGRENLILSFNCPRSVAENNQMSLPHF